jgi:peptidoglycan/xylan/chitin deacetylase (PgdA/CDA1 family)
MFPPKLVWDMPANAHGNQSAAEPTVYITFDDGPHPTATPFALEQLERYNAKATFFCVGNNVDKCPDIYRQLLQKGHATGNHTFDHVNGWKTDDSVYLQNIEKAGKLIHSNAFRPPYGRIRRSQVKQMKRLNPNWNIYMWTVLSGDFDKNISPEKCLDNVLKNIKPGSIILFHDSQKAWDRMSYALPHVLEYCQKQNWKMKTLPC